MHRTRRPERATRMPVVSAMAGALVVVMLVLGACASDPETPEAAPPESTATEVDDGEPGDDAGRATRSARDPKGGRLLAEPAPSTIVHVLGGLETVPATDSWPESLALLAGDEASVTSLGCAPPDAPCAIDAEALRDAGLDVVSLATGRADLAGAAALLEAAETLNAADIGTPGYGRDIARAVAPHLIIDGQTTVAVHAISLVDGLTSSATDATPGVAGPDALSALIDAITLSATSGHVTLVLVDWGDTGQRAPSASAVDVATQLAEAGAAAVIGTGGPTLQRLERIAGAPIVFDLGPAVAELADTAVFRFVVGSAVEATCLLPATASTTGPTLDDPDTLDCRP